MGWGEQVFIYCERGSDGAFLAEPLNAATNLAFVLAAALAWREQGRVRFPNTEARVLTLNVAAIGAGSFLFHTFAERWSSLADVIPIGVFMLLYLAVALRRFLGLGVIATTVLSLLFAFVCYGATLLRCGGGPCLGGSVAYLPAAGALVLVAAALLLMRSPASRLVGLAALVFPVSLTARTLDWPLCGATAQIGTHFLWHLLNALTLYLLLMALPHQGKPQR